MDSDLIGIIFAIIISAIIAWVEKVSKKKDTSSANAANATPQKAPRKIGVQASAPAHGRKEIGVAASVPPQGRSEIGVQASVPPQGRSEIGVQASAPAQAPVSRPFSLRDAIIWGEILRRKF